MGTCIEWNRLPSKTSEAVDNVIESFRTLLVGQSTKCACCESKCQYGMAPHVWSKYIQCPKHGDALDSHTKEDASGLCDDCSRTLIIAVLSGHILCHIHDCGKTLSMTVEGLAGKDAAIRKDKLKVCVFLKPTYIMERRNCTKCHAEIQAFPANELSYLQYPGDTKYFGEGKCQKCMKAVLEFDGRSGLTMLVNPSRERLVVSETWLTTYLWKVFECAVSGSPHVRHCSCGKGHRFHLRGEGTVMLCDSCSKVTCFKCPDEVACKHLGPKYQDMRTFNTKEAVAEVKRSTKVCPNSGCGALLDRGETTRGDVSVKCRCCGHIFCWVCKLIWNRERYYNSNDRWGAHFCHCRTGAYSANRTCFLPGRLENGGPYAWEFNKDEGYDEKLDEDLYDPSW